MVYTSAQPEDEAYHVKFHHKVVSALRFKVCYLLKTSLVSEMSSSTDES